MNKEWASWKTPLLISVFVVIVIAAVAYFILHRSVIKLRKKYETKMREEAFAEAATFSPDFEKHLIALQQKTENWKANDLLSAFLVNTTFINQFKDVYLEDNVDDFVAQILLRNNPGLNVDMLKPKSEGFVDIDSQNTVNKVDSLQKDYDLLLLLSSLDDDYEKQLLKLNYAKQSGMTVLIYNSYTKRQVKHICELLEQRHYRFEKVGYRSVSLLLIVKDDKSKTTLKK
ncbi:BC85_0335 family putative methyltransferase [Mycoplasma sp. 3341]|uniref:BC85_0335 family putative methyltransferase n=1 Tax=Mycoplasma sp. 3341 TaxID=3447506 RepID=UPI003F65AD2E